MRYKYEVYLLDKEEGYMEMYKGKSFFMAMYYMIGYRVLNGDECIKLEWN